jgi:Asp-tRNA(Asn)/Glu-tRNA(Gln) amidotransferase A subunit family amidase
MIPVSFGTQTTGSVIRPAAYCNTVGYKPTYGDINYNGIMPNTPTIDTLGMMVRSVEDLALMRSVLLEEAFAPLSPPAISDLRIGFYRSPFWDQADDDMQAQMESVAGKFSKLGASVTDVELPGIDASFENLHGLISSFEFSRTLSWERLNRYDQLSPVLSQGRMKDGMETTYEDYRVGTVRLERLGLETDDMLDNYDVLITPTATGEAPEGIGWTGNVLFNSMWTALGTPAVTLPIFNGPTGLPMGLQLVTGRFKDRRLFNIAEALMNVH